MTKITAFLGGGDWADASVTHLVLPEGLDLNAERFKYNAWYRDVYRATWERYARSHASTDPSPSLIYVSFTDWLERAGARAPTEDELEIESE